MIVNMVHGSRMSKLDGARTVRLTFDKNVTHIQRHSRHTGNIVTLVTDTSADGSRFLEFHLEGGTGDLFKWSNGNPWALDSRRASPESVLRLVAPSRTLRNQSTF